uniref:SKICH domain-containing protein n=1 Tax=Cyclopterus lumpus TaxID=8103 RepID=A0A8C2WPC4_CYCLU
MDKPSTVVFRNVGQLYFPQTRVECHYSLTSDHRWSSGDWIGIFEMGCSSVKQYYTYTWAVVPNGYTEGTSINCYVLFQGKNLSKHLKTYDTGDNSIEPTPPSWTCLSVHCVVNAHTVLEYTATSASGSQ